MRIHRRGLTLLAGLACLALAGESKAAGRGIVNVKVSVTNCYTAATGVICSAAKDAVSVVLQADPQAKLLSPGTRSGPTASVLSFAYQLSKPSASAGLTIITTTPQHITSKKITLTAGMRNYDFDLKFVDDKLQQP